MRGGEEREGEEKENLKAILGKKERERRRRNSVETGMETDGNLKAILLDVWLHGRRYAVC
eukprot:1340699-Amorphochlora_amoeboformis.AAC.1